MNKANYKIIESIIVYKEKQAQDYLIIAIQASNLPKNIIEHQ
jgi:hypothetical protein